MTQPFGRILMLLGLALVGALLLPSTAFGHADYDRSVPNANEVVAVPPVQIDVFFTQEVLKQEGANYVRVFDDDGALVSDGEGVVSDTDRTLISAMIPTALEEGRYIVQWKTLSDADGDEDSAAFCFFVVTQPTEEQLAECAQLQEGEQDPTAAVTGAATTGGTTSAETPEATPSETSDDEDDSSNTAMIIGIIIAVVVIGGAGAGVFFYMRQRQQG